VSYFRQDRGYHRHSILDTGRDLTFGERVDLGYTKKEGFGDLRGNGCRVKRRTLPKIEVVNKDGFFSIFDCGGIGVLVGGWREVADLGQTHS
jgi:hypothetical protein